MFDEGVNTPGDQVRGTIGRIYEFIHPDPAFIRG